MVLRCWGRREAGRKSRKKRRKGKSGRATYAEEEAAVRDVCGSRSAGCRNPSPLGRQFHCKNVVMSAKLQAGVASGH